MMCPCKNLKGIVLIVFALAACGGQPDGGRDLETALNIIEENSIYTADIDWEHIRRNAIVHASDAPTTSRTHDAIRFVLTELNDNHSHLLTPQDLANMRSTASGGSSNNERPTPRSVALERRISYVSLPSFVGSSTEAMTAFADSVQQQIADVDSNSVCGWIVDLRDNPGGNIWPMLAGIGPVLGEGTVSSYVYPDDTTADVWYRNGDAGVIRNGIFGRRSSVPQASISGDPYKLKYPNPGVAVIVGPRTGSSGELVAISFIGRSNARTFGTETLGLTTNNDSFPLEDGAALVLATSVMADRTGRMYGGSIQPDSVIESESPDLPLAEQVVISSASQWLRDQFPCRQ